ncbi:hypothetical protein I4F81_008144 [Pyropia yezoensis]|uniref:Uncharacterized protein n=1 Tax=Pyropia yezoensis TaxID=2788 RepID=A0ACC3C670_PYRYE|nr:hypothetical protein I4F81_008144 [Neopyropia yezoensis]
MPATAVTRTGLVTAWAAAIANVDVSWCKGVSGRLELLPLQGARSDVKPFVASAMSLTLCGTRLYGLTITSPPRPGTTLAVNASHCSLNVNGVLSLTELLVDGLPALEAVDAAGCRDLTRVSVRGCPALTRVDLRGKKSPMTSVHVSLAGGGVVLGVRGSWEVWESKESVRVDHGE